MNGQETINNALSSAEDSSDLITYFLARAEGLEQEVNKYHQAVLPTKHFSKKISEFKSSCQSLESGLVYEQWVNLCQQYRSLVNYKASILNEAATVARTYGSMEEFWSDATAQVQGVSQYTLWDSYEHGRRRQLESLLAKAYKSESALLLNCGMSAISSVIGALKLREGDVVITGERCYFETSEYLERYVSAQGVKILRVPVEDTVRILGVLESVRPKAALFETVTIVPDVPVISGFHRWSSVSPETIFIIDNTVQSHLTRWSDLVEDKASRLVIVESATKYLSEHCMAGVIYGNFDLVEQVRDFARTTGQQLQEKAFNYLCDVDIQLADRKLRRHARNVSAFREVLNEYSSFFQYINTLDARRAVSRDSLAIFNNGVGALIFLALAPTGSGTKAELELKHRRLLNAWRDQAKAIGLDIGIRAGYGWSETVARAYESGKLNQPDAPAYLRISVGIEPIGFVRLLAQALGGVAQRIA